VVIVECCSDFSGGCLVNVIVALVRGFFFLAG
jgi:hypothetical protein